jgi:hypothetical protein
LVSRKRGSGHAFRGSVALPDAHVPVVNIDAQRAFLDGNAFT